MSTETPPPLPESTLPAPPSYKRTFVLAAALFILEAFVSGGGFFSVLVIILVLPVLVIRALWAWKNRPMMMRRLGSVVIYFIAAVAGILLVQADQDGARERAAQVIAACEKYKKAKGVYPEKLSDLVPEFVSAVPKARLRGTMTPHDFTYIVAGPNGFVQTTNAHVLMYTSAPPFGRSYCIFEEMRWGSYD